MNGRRIDPADDEDRVRELAQIRDALQGLRYGTVQVIVQDGMVIQIERTERRRLRHHGNKPANDERG